MRFAAIDVETSNARMHSICQIGIALFEGGEHVDGHAFLVDPEEHFDALNVRIHGISERDVLGSPSFAAIASKVFALLAGRMVVSHMPFDKGAIYAASRRYELAPPDLTWLDSAKVARRTWPQFARAGYNLANLASECGVQFRAHDALEDAMACGHVLVRAVRESGIALEDWPSRSSRPITQMPGHPPLTYEGSGEGPLAGEVLVFTGSLNMPRREAAALAAALGCEVSGSVTSRTTLVVVGEQDIAKLAGKNKSSKHLAAERLVAEGGPIRIVAEPDFLALLEN